MALQACDSLGLLVWLLLLQPRLGKARTVPETLSLSPLPSEDGLDDPGVNPQERPLTGMPETSLPVQPGGSTRPLDPTAFPPGHSFPTLSLSRQPFPTWIPPTSGEVSGPWPSRREPAWTQGVGAPDVEEDLRSLGVECGL